ncbi:MAG: sugar nucleotide-binding protein [bacterium]|nr:sugar nucleotide-binding protein [bacterium]
MQKKVLILGAGGMLGGAVYDVLKDKYQLVLTVRKSAEIDLLEKAYGEIANHQVEEFDVNFIYQDYYNKKGYFGDYFSAFLKKINEVDYIINAIGITIPFSLENPLMTFFINSAFPFILQGAFNERLIHITTDCVYNGKEGFPYNELSPKSAVDLYGLSKSLGEPTECLTLRTSIIGREMAGFTGLLEWFLQQNGKTINGFSGHFWNGVTTKQFGKICGQIIESPDIFLKKGIYHIFSNTVSKYEMLLKLKEKYKVNCEIIPEESNKLNRTLSTIYPLCGQLKVPSFDEMLKEL